ncbi:hypothetical protein HHL19_01985 [Streptomyces sp. R302]|uniref:hypothetical protein n=1 Tax=unclassified Streptomyces TaxID=2593676 RepID=UPI00145DBBDE|nr:MULTISPECIES: hypothetical protein [unclassified Streptomyces]NML49131.1 hypothetical protein [Streptomyces sp. R301]NML77458.1 hypothetical protein [Streptomyces sp. R302]
MPDIAEAAAALTGIAAAAQQGPGDTLRIVLLVSMVGGALLAWFLLRGYGRGDTGEHPAGQPEDTSARGASEGAEDANA